MQETGETGIARRVLILTARMGGGHDAAAAALAGQICRRWPGSDVRVVDTLDVMGAGIGTVFRAIYVVNVRYTPCLYQFFYDSLWRHRWFARTSKALTSAWAGRRLATEIEDFGPDLILSTYPLAAGGLAWLRRRRSLAAGTYAWVTDFAPHPFWLYRGLDNTFVVHESVLGAVEAAEPGMPADVAAAPVSTAFHPGDRALGRLRLGLEAEDLVVLISGGAYGFGAIADAVQAALDAGPDVRVVVACGRNERLRRRLAGQVVDRSSYRLRLLGWRDDMPEVTRAADIVVTNAGGMTALEALQCDLPVVLYRPIAAHGRANAQSMAAAGIAMVCSEPDELTRIISKLAQDGDWTSAAARYHAGTGSDPLRQIGTSPREDRSDQRRPWPLRSQDAFFLYVQNASISQQVGAIIVARADAGAAPLTGELLRERIGQALPLLSELRRRPVTRGRLRRPGWITDSGVDLDRHVVEEAAADDDGVRRLMDRFWSEPLALDTPPWQVLLITRRGADSVLGFKFHHSLGDAMSLIGALDRIVDPPDLRRRRQWVRQVQPARTPERIRRLGRIARGVWELGVHAAAPATGLNRPLSAASRGVLTLSVASRDLRAISARYRCRGSELMLTILAEAIARSGLASPKTRVARAPERIRTMVPVAMGLAAGGRTGGNRTGVVSIDLPLGAQDFASRLAGVRRDLARRTELGEPEAGAFVMAAIGGFPAPVHAWMSRRVYNAAFFNLLTSYIPGSPRPRRLAGHTLTEVYPVLALAEDVPLAVGVMKYGGTTGICLLFDESVRRHASELRAAIEEVIAEQLEEQQVTPDAAEGSGWQRRTS